MSEDEVGALECGGMIESRKRNVIKLLPAVSARTDTHTRAHSHTHYKYHAVLWPRVECQLTEHTDLCHCQSHDKAPGQPHAGVCVCV